MLKLYYSPGACALASHIGFEEAEADYEAVRIDLKAGEQKSPEYLAVNPAGVTPALMTDRGVITENVAILAFLAQTFPNADLVPIDDPFAFARFNAFNGWLGSSLHPAMGQLLFSRPPLEGEAREAARKTVLDKLTLAETHLVEGPWVFGEMWTLSDGYLSVFARWARQADLLDKHDYPRLNAHLDLVQSRDAVKRALKAQGIEPV